MKPTLLLLLPAFCLLACNKETTPPLTKQEIKQKIDSITSIRIKELDAMAQRDLQHRIKIEVKINADSILNATRGKKPGADSAIPVTLPLKIRQTLPGDSSLLK